VVAIVRPRQKHVVAALFVAGMFVSILDSTAVTTALPTIGREFHATPSAVDWTVIGYLLSLAACMPASGWLGDRIGTKTTFLAAMGLFTAASALCATAPDLPALVGFRVLQGVGGGLLTPVGQAMLYRAYPPERRARAAAVLLVPTVMAPALGPVLGGFLVDQLSWRWVFLVNLPIGAAALAFGLACLAERREAHPGRFDVAGFILAACALALILYAASEGPVLGWGRVPVWAAGALGIAAAVAFVCVELAARAPMLSVRLLDDRLFRACNLTSLLGGAAFMGVLFLMPQFLQYARGASAFSSGLTTFPEAIGVMLSSRLVARLYPRVGPRRLMAGGLTAVTLLILALTRIGPATDPWWVRLGMFGVGAGMAYMILPLQAAAFAGISAADTGRASALFATQRQVAGALGAALAGTMVAAFLPAGAILTGGALRASAAAGAFHLAFAACAVLAAAGAAVALGVPDALAAATMVRGPRRARAVEPAPVVADG